MINGAILLAYLIGLLAHRSWLFLLCVITFASSFIFYAFPNPDTNDIVISFLIYSSSYLILSYKLFKHSHLSACAMAGIISAYDLIFAYDTFVNSNVETWIYINHEDILLVLHIALVCLFSKKCNTILDSCWHNITRVFSDVSHIQPNRRCSKGAQGKEES